MMPMKKCCSVWNTWAATLPVQSEARKWNNSLSQSHTSLDFKFSIETFFTGNFSGPVS